MERDFGRKMQCPVCQDNLSVKTFEVVSNLLFSSAEAVAATHVHFPALIAGVERSRSGCFSPRTISRRCAVVTGDVPVHAEFKNSPP